MRYVGIDFGTKRIGIAISDEEGSFAFPKMIVKAEEAVAEIAGLCQQESVGTIVIGKSVASNGAENDIVALAESFKEKIHGVTGLPVYFQEEGFSTVEAHRYQVDAGNRDDSAAAIILQRYLDTHKVQ
ncbi:MAG TPA: Holliday junction resolvase RuvX [Candidatus Paceibacterota bacterium]|jgi:putative Holliday junction resolvase|nr:Holliday junction resolvase RuvX [Candidatus Paceibacterota bacterium]